jgi:WD40 repeat protein
LVAVIGDQRMRHWGNGERARCVALSPDNRWIVSGGTDGVRVWDAATGKLLRFIPRPRLVVGVWVLAGGTRLGLVDSNEGFFLYEPMTGKYVATLPGRPLGVSPDGSLLATRSGAGGTEVAVWQAANAKEYARFKGHAQPVGGMGFSADGKLAASGGQDLTVQVWETATGKVTQTLKGATRADIDRVRMSADGKIVASWGSSWGELKVWDVATGRPFSELPPTARMWELAPDGKAMVIRGGDNVLRLWDLVARRERKALSTETPATTAAFSPDSQLVATGVVAATESLRLWDVSTGASRPALKGQSGWVTGLAFSADGRALAATTSDGAVTLWDTATSIQRLPAPDGNTLALSFGSTVDLIEPTSGKRRARLGDHRDIVTALDFAPDSQTLATSSREGTIKFWDMASGQLQTTARSDEPVWSVRYLPDGKTVVSSGFSHLQFWDTASGLVRTSWPAPRKERFAQVIMSADCSLLLATTDTSNQVRFWDVETGKERPSVGPFPGRSHWPMLSPDGKLLAVRNENNTIKLWDLAGGKERAALPACHVAAFSPDNRSLLGASEDGQLRIWDMATGQMRIPLEGHTVLVTALAYSPDGRLAVSASQDGRVIVWDPAARKRRVRDWQLPGPVQQIGFAPDSRHLITINSNGSVYILRLAGPQVPR